MGIFEKILSEVKCIKSKLFLVCIGMFLAQGITAGDIEQILPPDSNFTIDGSGSLEVMRVQSDGLVGIGTTVPHEKLEVNGSIRMTDGNEAANTVMVGDAAGTASWADISAIQDGNGTDDQQLQAFTLSGTDLNLSLEDGGSVNVDLSPLAGTGTDDQNLTLSGNTLSIESGNSVDLAGFNQTTSVQAVQAALAAHIADANASFNDINTTLQAHIATDLDTNATNEIQDLTYKSGTNILSIENGNDVNLSVLQHTGTTGSIFFAGADGKPTENNANLFWNNTTKRMGVGTASPESVMHIKSNNAYEEYTVESSGSKAFFGVYDTTKIMYFNAYAADPLSIYLNTGTNGELIYLQKGTGNVGIGTTTPHEKLELSGHIRMRDGNQAANTVMVGDAAGTASWADISTIQDGNGTDDQNISSAVNIPTESVSINLENGGSTLISIQDADSNATNEIQDLSYNPVTHILHITNNISATDINLSSLSSPASVPYIADTSTYVLAQSTTSTLVINGENFIPSTSVSIVNPPFTGTINSINVLSPTKIELNITTDGTLDIYDILLSNNGVLNTQWSGNGVNMLQVAIGHNGQNQAQAGLSCKKILDDGFSIGSGTYWINPNGGSTADAFQVYCDMTTDGGGWTRLEYAADLPHTNRWTSGDADRWLSNNFTLTLTDTQINDIRAVSTEGKQRYHGSCEGVLHYYYTSGSSYNYAFGFRFHNGDETVFDQQNYPGTNITVPNDGCGTNNNAVLGSTDFDILDIRVPVVNVHSRDNGNNGEKFGSPLTNYPAWLR